MLISKGISTDYIIALDEVGRGALAGPVCVGASLWCASGKKSLENHPEHGLTCHKSTKHLRPFIQDSKKVTEKKRELFFDTTHELFPAQLLRTAVEHNTSNESQPCFKPQNHQSLQKNPRLKSHAVTFDKRSICLGFALGSATATEVDTYNIWGAIQRAAARALGGLVDLYPSLAKTPPTLWVDGKLPLPLWEPYHTWPQYTWIQGDGESVAIGFSSILAKVARDRVMRAWDTQFPAYGFAKHKGYGTQSHQDALKKAGVSCLHRMSFLSGILPTTREAS